MGVNLEFPLVRLQAEALRIRPHEFSYIAFSLSTALNWCINHRYNFHGIGVSVQTVRRTNSSEVQVADNLNKLRKAVKQRQRYALLCCFLGENLRLDGGTVFLGFFELRSTEAVKTRYLEAKNRYSLDRRGERAQKKRISHTPFI